MKNQTEYKKVMLALDDKIRPCAYTWIDYTPSAPAHGAAKKWVRNRDVWALLMPVGESPTSIRDPRIVRKISFGCELDSR